MGVAIRLFIAFLVAPLWVPAAMMALLLLDDPSEAISAAMLSASFAYGGTIVFGIPTYLILRSRNVTALWLAVAAGFAFGLITWLIFAVYLWLWFGFGLAHSLALAAESITKPASWLSFLIAGLLGAAVGATFWKIARPDRERAQT